jgi:hypothetical protein
MGVGFHEAPRGALSHWVVIDNGKIKNYQCVVPSTWNACPRNEKDEPGPYEASLLNTPIADAEKPLEVLAHHPFIRPLHRLRDPPDRQGKQYRHHGKGGLIAGSIVGPVSPAPFSFGANSMRAVVLGVGNIILSDEAAGVRAVEEFAGRLVAAGEACWRSMAAPRAWR